MRRRDRIAKMLRSIGSQVYACAVGRPFTIRALVSVSACTALLTAGLVIGTAEAVSASAPAPTCTGTDLSETIYPLAGAGGTMYGDVKLTDKAGHRCELNIRPHSMYFTADAHGDRVGAWGAYDFETIYPGTGTAARKHFDLSADGGHVYIRIGIGPAGDYSNSTCQPIEVNALVTHVQGSSAAISGALPDGPLTICSNTRIRTLHFGQYRTHRSTYTH